MVKIADEFTTKKLEAQLIMQVHDELVVECPDTEAEIVKKILQETMEHIVNWDIPMSVEIGVGKNWLEAKG
jgi:DNA polymerase-1